MEPPIDREDVTSIIRGVFGIRGYLGDLAADVAAIRALLEDGDKEEDEDG